MRDVSSLLFLAVSLLFVTPHVSSAHSDWHMGREPLGTGLHCFPRMLSIITTCQWQPYVMVFFKRPCRLDAFHSTDTSLSGRQRIICSYLFPYKPTNIPSLLKRFSKKQQQRNDYVGRGWRLCGRGYLGEGVIEVVKKRWQQLNHDVDVQKANPSVSVCVCECVWGLCCAEIRFS